MCCVICLTFVAVLFAVIVKWLLVHKRLPLAKDFSVGFFHPYCNAGGGGERVLWCAIRELQKRLSPDVRCVVYTGDLDATDEEILRLAESRFNVRLDKPVTFVRLRWRRLVEAQLYPVFTLLGQSVGGLLLGVEAMWKFTPDVFVDSMGYPFVLPLFRYVGRCRVGCYVHYPTISTDMLGRVRDRRETYNNRGVVSRSPLLSRVKLLYYQIFAFFYGLVGRSADVMMVNGSWTKNHIVELWKRPERTTIVYPPCDVAGFKSLVNTSEDLLATKHSVRILSIGQFRPEKNHQLQLEALSHLIRSHLDSLKTPVEVKLVFLGSCRHDEDYQRVAELKAEAKRLKVDDFVEWKLNVSHKELQEQLSLAMIGLNAMWNEHFGIGVVEGMAAGNIMVANNTGGPKLDIVTPDSNGDPTGFLAETAESYADAFAKVIRMTPAERDQMRLRAKCSVDRFSDERFNERFYENFQKLMKVPLWTMKLFSLIVFYKGSNNEVRQLKGAYSLDSFGFFQRSTVKEFMTFTGKVIVERSPLCSRSSVKEQEYMCHAYLRQDGLSAVLVADTEYESRVAFNLLTRVLADFADKVPPHIWPTGTEATVAYMGLDAFLAKFQDPKNADAMTRLQDDLDETKIVLHDTIEKVLQRGEKLDDLVDKSEGLSAQSKMFYTQAKKMNKCCSWV